MTASPQAPAREGVEAAADAIRKCQALIDKEAEKAEAIIRGKYGRRMIAGVRFRMALTIDALLDEALHALTPREEAPAEGTGELGGGDVIATVDPARWDHPLSPQLAYAYGWNDALRARTSEPEAREAVPFMWAYEAVTDGEWRAFPRQLQRADGSICPGRALYTHPAPASADKLRVAVEALEKVERWFGEFPETGRNWPNDDGSDSDRPMSYGAVNGSNGERDFMRHVARQALAALNEGGK